MARRRPRCRSHEVAVSDGDAAPGDDSGMHVLPRQPVGWWALALLAVVAFEVLLGLLFGLAMMLGG